MNDDPNDPQTALKAMRDARARFVQAATAPSIPDPQSGISTDDINETARMLGVTRRAAPQPSAAEGNPSYLVMPSDIAETARMLGIGSASSPVIPKQVKTQSVKKPIILPGRQDVQPSGKVAYEPGDVITPQEQTAGDVRGLGGQFVSGIPIAGPLMNRAAAALSTSPADAGKSFSDRFYAQERADKAFALANPVTSTLAQVAGGAAGYGLGGLTGTGRALMGMTGPGWGARVYQGALGGGAISGLDAALRGEDPLQGAEIGAAGGVAGATAGEGARALTGTAAQYLWPRPGPLKDVSRAGINLLMGGLEGETPASIAAAKTEIGPRGFLGDISQGMTNIAQAVAAKPGQEGQSIVRDAYRDRLAQQAPALDAAVTRALGPKTNIVDYERFLTEARKAAADPLYQAWRDTQVQPTAALKALIPRLEKSGAFDAAQELAGITGDKIDRNFWTPEPSTQRAGIISAYPTTQTWDYVKRGLDRRIDAAYSAGDKTLARSLVGLKGEMIDEIGKTPAGQVWQQARSEFADRSALIDQISAGRDTFIGGRSGMSVDELRDELKGLKGPELAARIQGARAAMSEGMGDSLSGDTTLRNKLLATNNQEKLRLLIGDQPANQLIASLKSLKKIGEKTTEVIPNMNTGASAASRAENLKMLGGPETPGWLGNLDLMKPGTLLPAALHPHNVMQAFANERAGRLAPSLAPLLTMQQGPKMDELVSALTRERDRISGVHEAMAPWINRLTGTVSGPLQGTYRRYYENQRP